MGDNHPEAKHDLGNLAKDLLSGKGNDKDYAVGILAVSAFLAKAIHDKKLSLDVEPAKGVKVNLNIKEKKQSAEVVITDGNKNIIIQGEHNTQDPNDRTNRVGVGTNVVWQKGDISAEVKWMIYFNQQNGGRFGKPEQEFRIGITAPLDLR